MIDTDYTMLMHQWGINCHLMELKRIQDSTDQQRDHANLSVKTFQANDEAGRKDAANLLNGLSHINTSNVQTPNTPTSSAV